jgi:hypothetical protein
MNCFILPRYVRVSNLQKVGNPIGQLIEILKPEECDARDDAMKKPKLATKTLSFNYLLFTNFAAYG